ncbi:MAG: hypothetical protein R2867_37510 [Caldilineaceae bacterium]
MDASGTSASEIPLTFSKQRRFELTWISLEKKHLFQAMCELDPTKKYLLLGLFDAAFAEAELVTQKMYGLSFA